MKKESISKIINIKKRIRKKKLIIALQYLYPNLRGKRMKKYQLGKIQKKIKSQKENIIKKNWVKEKNQK